jgi:sugar phosphate isomerase/epimerase
MKLSQVAVQLYTLRDHCKTAADLAATAKKVRAIGYEAVQISGVGPIPPTEIAAIIKGEGLTICATHEDSKTILEEPAKVVERLRAFGTNQTAYPYPAGIDFSSLDSVKALCAKLDAAGEVLASEGISLSYHNHEIEFVKVGGRIALDYILAHTRPSSLALELDTYWAAVGGVDPAGYCLKYPDRLPLLHLKDFKLTSERRPSYCEIGAGNLDFASIIAAAESSGCRWFIVEQDTCPGDPFDSIKQSFDYIRDNLV